MSNDNFASIIIEAIECIDNDDVYFILRSKLHDLSNAYKRIYVRNMQKVYLWYKAHKWSNTTNSFGIIPDKTDALNFLKNIEHQPLQKTYHYQYNPRCLTKSKIPIVCHSYDTTQTLDQKESSQCLTNQILKSMISDAIKKMNGVLDSTVTTIVTELMDDIRDFMSIEEQIKLEEKIIKLQIVLNEHHWTGNQFTTPPDIKSLQNSLSEMCLIPF